MSPDISLAGIGNGTGELTSGDFDLNLCAQLFLTQSLFHLSYLGNWVNSFRRCVFAVIMRQHSSAIQILCKFLDN